MLQLYDNHISVCAQAVRLALFEKQLDWRKHPIRFQTNDRFSPAYLKLNPKGQVPTLVHDGFVVVESTVILEYLEDCFPGRPLRPADPRERTRMRLWTKKVDEGIHAACGHLTFATAWRGKYLAKSPEQIARDVGQMKDKTKRERRIRCLEQGLDAAEVIDSIHVFDRMLAEMEAALTDRAALAGDSVSLADFKLLPYVLRLDQLSLAWMWDKRPAVAAWFGRMRERPSFVPAITDVIPQNEIDELRAGGQENRAKIEEILALVPA